MLLDQLARSLKGPVLRFSAGLGGLEGWAAFVREAEEHPDAVLLVDDLQWLLELQEGQAGRAGWPGESPRRVTRYVLRLIVYLFTVYRSTVP